MNRMLCFWVKIYGYLFFDSRKFRSLAHVSLTLVLSRSMCTTVLRNQLLDSKEAIVDNVVNWPCPRWKAKPQRGCAYAFCQVLLAKNPCSMNSQDKGPTGRCCSFVIEMCRSICRQFQFRAKQLICIAADTEALAANNYSSHSEHRCPDGKNPRTQDINKTTSNIRIIFPVGAPATSCDTSGDSERWSWWCQIAVSSSTMYMSWHKRKQACMHAAHMAPNTQHPMLSTLSGSAGLAIRVTGTGWNTAQQDTILPLLERCRGNLRFPGNPEPHYHCTTPVG